MAEERKPVFGAVRKVLAWQVLQRLSDEELLQRFVSTQDQASFATVVRRYNPMVWRVCRRILGDHHDAEDACQATFLVLARKAGNMGRPELLASWLYGIAYRTALRAKADTARRRRHETAATCEVIQPPTDGALHEALALLDQELYRLRDCYRGPLILCYLEGRTRDQAARQLGLSLRTLERRLEQGRSLLRVRMLRRGVSLPLAMLLCDCAIPTVGAAPLAAGTTASVLQLLAGKSAEVGGTSMRVLVLANAILRGLALAKAKSAALVLFAVTALLVAGGLAAQQVGAPVRPEPNHPQPAAQALVQQPALQPQNDKLPAGALMRLGQDGWLHSIITDFAWFLPDGKKVITVNIDRTIRIWDFPGGKEIARMTLPATYNSELLHFMMSMERRPMGAAAALTADGTVIAASPDGTDIHFYDVASFRQLPVRIALPSDDLFKGFPLRIGVESMAFAPDGKWLAAMTSTGELIIWDWRHGKELHKVALGVRGENDYALGYQVVFSPDGQLVAVGQDESRTAKRQDSNTVTILNATSGVVIKQIRIESRAYRSNRGFGSAPLAFSPESKTLAFVRQYDVIFAETATGNEVGKLIGVAPEKVDVLTAGDNLSSVAFSKDGTKLYANSIGGIMEWAVAGRKMLRTTGRGGVKKANETLKANRRVDNGGDGVMSLSPDGKTLMITGIGPRFFDLTPGKDITAINEITAPMKSLQFLADGKTLQTRQIYQGGGVGGGWQDWDLVTGKKVGPLKANKGGPMSTASSTISPDGKVTARFSPLPKNAKKGTDLAAIANAHTVQLIDTKSGKEIGVLTLPPGPELLPAPAEPGGVAFSPDGRCLALNLPDGTTDLYELATGKPRATFGKKRPEVKATMQAPAYNNMVVSNSQAEARLCFAFSPDGSFFAYSGPDAVVHVSDLLTGKQVTEFKGHTERVNMFAFAPDGKTLASASDDSTVLIWEVSKLARPKAAAGAPRPGELEAWWQNLAANDAAEAFTTIAALAAAPREAVAWIKDRVKPAAAIDDKRVHDLIAQLDAEQFNTRARATQELLEIGEQIVPILDKTLSAKVPLETKQRLEALRGKLTGTLLQGEALRAFRAVEVLELIGTPEARRVLEGLALGAAGARLTTSAQAALER